MNNDGGEIIGVAVLLFVIYLFALTFCSHSPNNVRTDLHDRMLDFVDKQVPQQSE